MIDRLKHGVPGAVILIVHRSQNNLEVGKANVPEMEGYRGALLTLALLLHGHQAQYMESMKAWNNFWETRF